MADECKCASLRAQVEFLAGELSRARIRPDHDRCCRCTEYGYEACRLCWINISEIAAYKDSLLKTLGECGD